MSLRNNTVLWCLISVVVTCAATLGVVSLVDHRPQQEFAQKQVENEPAEENYQYIIGEYAGRVAVFGRGQSEPDIVYNVYTRQLPRLDAEQLREGVKIEDYPTLVKRIEDYIS